MTLARVVLGELDREGRAVQITDSHAQALAATGLVDARAERQGWRLLPRDRVGSVRIGDLQIEVRPKDKVQLTRLLFLLGYARDPGFRPEDVQAVPDEDLWPALAESLARQTRTALGPGVLQGYRTIDEALRTVRGRIRIGDQILRRPGQMIPIEVTHDEFTTDIAENQILRSALRRMLTVPGLSQDARGSLGHFDGQLAGVTVMRPRARLPQWRPSRLNQRYAPALRLAEIILRNASAEAGPGDLTMAAFVVDMATVYENFVSTALREALAPFPGGTRMQYKAHLDVPDHSSRLTMHADVVQVVNGVPRIIFDAKYKAAGAFGSYPNADHYQMLAYCTAMKVPTAWLVYAGGGQPRRRRIVNTDITVVEYPLDLSAHPQALLDQIDRLARAAWQEQARAQATTGESANRTEAARAPVLR